MINYVFTVWSIFIIHKNGGGGISHHVVDCDNGWLVEKDTIYIYKNAPVKVGMLLVTVSVVCTIWGI